MKLGEILAKAGGVVLRNIVPGAGIVIDAINEFLPEDKKLPEDATGSQALGAVNALPADKQAALLSREYDVEIAEIDAWARVQASLAEADKANSSTRPAIAMMMARTVCFAVIVLAGMTAAAVALDKTEALRKLAEAWPLVLSVLATPTALLRAYFGMRTREKENRYAAAAGGRVVPGGPMAEVLKSLLGKTP